MKHLNRNIRDFMKLENKIEKNIIKFIIRILKIQENKWWLQMQIVQMEARLLIKANYWIFKICLNEFKVIVDYFYFNYL